VSYAAAQAAIRQRGRELTSLQASAYCVAPATFVAKAQRILDRLGWSGWRVRTTTTAREQADVIGAGDCALLPVGDNGQPDVRAALDPDHHLLSFDLGPPPALARRLQSLAVSIESSTASRCWTDDALRAYVTNRLARYGLAAAFDIAAGEVNALSDAGQQALYEHGCPLVFLIRTAAGTAQLVDVLIFQRGGTALPPYGLPAQSAFH
jgi:hypothetical protein